MEVNPSAAATYLIEQDRTNELPHERTSMESVPKLARGTTHSFSKHARETTHSFGTRLARAIETRGPLCVGIDPHPTLLSRWGLPDTVDGLTRFSRTCVEALAGRVAVMKPQSAFFERFGSAGIAVLESTIRQCRAAGALVILDVKRADIGSTAQAYAHAYLNRASPMWADAITVSPYLGFGAIEPIIDEAQAFNNGVFVLALTSNPEGAEVQHARAPDGRTVAQMVLDHVAKRNAGEHPLGSVGVVVGATVAGFAAASGSAWGTTGHASVPTGHASVPTGHASVPTDQASVPPGPAGHDLSRLNGPVLAPGIGPQGASAADLRAVFAGLSGAVLPTLSREVLARGPSVTGLREAAERSLVECRKVLEPPDM
jgi:orotidine-5'-phosphate decarboxylase